VSGRAKGKRLVNYGIKKNEGRTGGSRTTGDNLIAGTKKCRGNSGGRKKSICVYLRCARDSKKKDRIFSRSDDPLTASRGERVRNEKDKF